MSKVTDHTASCDLTVTIKVFFKQARHEEHHPYGSTYATEVLFENEDYAYEMNGMSVTRPFLVGIFGEEVVENAINEAMDNA